MKFFSWEYCFYLLNLFLVALSINLYPQESASLNFVSDYDDAFNFLFSLQTSGEQIKLNEAISFTKDVGNFKLTEGFIYPCKYFNKETIGFYFSGKGKFSFTPSTDIEKEQLYRFYETRNFETKFENMLVLFDDSTGVEILKGRDKEKIDSDNIDEQIEDCLSYFLDSDVGYARSDLLRALIHPEKTGFFYAHINPDKSNPVFFQINPFEFEEVCFMKDKKGVGLIGSDKGREIINQFPAQNETLKNYLGKGLSKYFLDIISYKIESTIEDNLDFSAKCIIDFNTTDRKQKWIMFYLYNELVVDSVKCPDGSLAKFINSEESSELWIKIKNELLDLNQSNLTIYYHGDLLEKDQLGWISLKSSVFWYPRFNNNEKAAFGLIFHTPEKYNLVSIGEQINTSKKNDIVTTTWMCISPTRNASFNIGSFKEYITRKENLPDVSVYISEFGHQTVSNALVKYGIYSMSDASEYIGQDIAGSMQLFKEFFGDPPFNSIRVSEIPYLHGEAFPGLIHLSWATVIQSNFEGEDEVFRAHEVAHQWWGVGVDFKTYHDQWLSEGFSQYSGLMYLQAVKKDNELFFDILNKWKEEILNVRQYIFSSGQEAGPVWLGYRTSSSNTTGDYNLIIYKKGACILHMLRALLLDLNSMNEDRFKNMMREFYEKYKNNFALTSDFKKIVDKHLGQDMSWFFDQYVYGTDIPLYKVAYKSEDTEDGKIRISIRVKQEDVPDKFKMYVPIKFLLDGNKFARIRIEVKGKETNYTTPPVDGELDELIFNDLESVLCKVEYEDWD